MLLLLLLAIVAAYLSYVNLVAAPGSTLKPSGGALCARRTVDSGSVIFVYGFKRLGYGYLCYRVVISRNWSTDPATPLFLDVYIVNLTAPWYVRGYSVEASRVLARVEGLPDTLWYRSLVEEGRTTDGRGYTLKVRVYLEGYIAREYNATLHLTVALRVREWTILGPTKTLEAKLVNLTLPITIGVKYVYPP